MLPETTPLRQQRTNTRTLYSEGDDVRVFADPMPDRAKRIGQRLTSPPPGLLRSKTPCGQHLH